MQNIVRNNIINQDIKEVFENFIGWEYFYKRTIMVTGATGVIGSFIIRCLIHANKKRKLHLKILAVVRDINKGKTFFSKNKIVKLVVQDVNKKISYCGKVDFILHCASNTSSASFVETPVETLDVAVSGTKNILDFALRKKVRSLVYLSSMEAYGELDADRGLTKEEDLGYIDILKPRSSYQMGKRTAEAYCAYYAKEKNVPVKIARLAQTIASNIGYNDPRVFAYFARCVIEKKDIVLSTTGEAIRSSCYITDAVRAILTILLDGENGQPYNVANKNCISSIKDMALMLIEKHPEISLKFDLKDSNKYPTNKTNWLLDTQKLEALGWSAQVDLEQMFNNVIESFRRQLNYVEPRPYTFLEKIFSVKNEKDKKVISILNHKIRIPQNLFYSSYTKIYQRIFGIKQNKIVFSNYLGSGYGCNPKFITEELLKRNKDLEIVWIVRRELMNQANSDFPKGIKLVPHKSRQSFKELATAKVWVDNYHKIAYLKKGLIKSPEQVYIQTWHGSLGIKKIEKAVEILTSDTSWLYYAISNSENTDYWISNSKFETDVYNDSFWEVKNIKEYGHPRNDIFFLPDTNPIKQKVLNKLNIPSDRKLLLYVPSFREDCKLHYYDIDYPRLTDALAQKFGGQWNVAVRLHPRLRKYSSTLIKNNELSVDATNYSDIQELLVAADAVITDYSSCIFDFMLTERPAFIYATDLELYNTERGFYYPLESTPFPISTNNDELVQKVLNFDEVKYKQEVKAFLAGKGCIEDGHASERVADLIEGIIEDAKK